jgi:hypothetical protein
MVKFNRLPKPAAHLLRKLGFSAITLPPFGIYFVTEEYYSERLRRHELCHWRQYKRMGLFAFYLKYISLFFRHGYYDHPMEIEARLAENKGGNGS